MERDLRVGKEYARDLMHVHSIGHTDNLTVMRIRKFGHGCLHCAHCKNQSKKMARLEQFRYNGKCMAHLSPAELDKVEVPDNFNDAKLQLQLVLQRTERINAKCDEM